MPEPPALLTAINLTLTTIDRRIRLYRALVVVVILAGLGVPVLSIYFKSWLALLAITSIIPAVAVYLYIDKSVVQRWAKQVLMLVREKQLDLGQFTKTIGSFRHIPQATLKTMLSLISPEVGSQA